MNSSKQEFNPYDSLFPKKNQAEAFRKAKMLLAEHFINAAIVVEFEHEIDGVVGSNHVVGLTAGVSAGIGLMERGKKSLMP